ncbi:type II toxin-antitoxin system death-on-curing family toxin [Mucilaginibacter aquariorum]|uniref:Type II toxin-antitoxin system death-on-curing family toxin n=1 Tax=Mucilaginibacter aquariorum TaxID=2967225 RepID=A0ABT1T0L6_9SPHI|nr:type II toxin-antitoxin system death-on-curing family toxin [Mucilaginibacter aquariorum]MCQ6958018.1 type II toxin-antitoxin system death-on-curing family toxin [Mucilaginibacter aquariorum]
MISFQSAVRIHDKLIEQFGGSKEVRDESLLESALNRPFATFDGTDIYPTSIEKATALFESLIINHPFMDGNKRMAYTLMEILLRVGSLHLTASKEEKYVMVINASTGEMRFDDIKAWLEQNSKPL